VSQATVVRAPLWFLRIAVQGHTNKWVQQELISKRDASSGGDGLKKRMQRRATSILEQSCLAPRADSKFCARLSPLVDRKEVIQMISTYSMVELSGTLVDTRIQYARAIWFPADFG
jgi:hypothetical protein